MDVPVIETPRLRLVGWSARHLDAFAAIHGDPEVVRYLGDGQPMDRFGSWRSLAAMAGHWVLYGLGVWAVEAREGGALLGRVGFLRPEGWPELELAWTLGRAHWGQGYASEAARAAREYGRAHWGVRRLVSYIRPDNANSIRVAERLGCRAEGVITLRGGQAQVWAHPTESLRA